jgi:hypothetical protein
VAGRFSSLGNKRANHTGVSDSTLMESVGEEFAAKFNYLSLSQSIQRYLKPTEDIHHTTIVVIACEYIRLWHSHG